MDSSNHIPKILVFSHNPFSDNQNNGKTLQSFFTDWPKDRICQLFLTNDEHSCKVCENFFRITDWEMLIAFFKRKYNAGHSFIGERDNKTSFNDVAKKRRNPIIKIAKWMGINRISIGAIFRDLLWKNAFKNELLNNWIEEQKPDILFFLGGGAVSSFALAEQICQKYKLPMIMQTTDDYVSWKFSLDPFFFVYIKNMQKAYKNAVKRSSCVIAIGDKMAAEYGERFGGNYKIAMNSVPPQSEDFIQKNNNTDSPIKMIYTGNLGIGRWKVLRNLSKSLEFIEKKYNIKCELKIYSLISPSNSILKAITNPRYSQFCGSLNQDELKEAQSGSDILVHVESFGAKNRYITRLSISTKIPEYMNTGKCILAIGPKDVASMEYLSDNNAAISIFHQTIKSISATLADALSDTPKMEECIKNSYELIRKNHDISKIRMMIHEEIMNAYSKNN